MVPFFEAREPESWVFLVGCYNSGTTLLREILEAHPAISTLPFEGVKLTSAFPDLERSEWPRMMYRFRQHWRLSHDDASKLVAQAKRDWAPWWNRNARVFLEKSIDHTTRMGWLARHFGEVKFVAITRNGYAVCEGVLRRSAPQGAAAAEVGSTYPPSMVAQQWLAFEQEISAQINPERDVHLTYEAIMSDPIPSLTQVFEKLGVEIPAMSRDGDVLTVGSRTYHLNNQNDRSIARLPEAVRDELTEVLRHGLTERGYEVIA